MLCERIHATGAPLISSEALEGADIKAEQRGRGRSCPLPPLPSSDTLCLTAGVGRRAEPRAVAGFGERPGGHLLVHMPHACHLPLLLYVARTFHVPDPPSTPHRRVSGHCPERSWRRWLCPAAALSLSRLALSTQSVAAPARCLKMPCSATLVPVH